ncbi:MAG: patatin [Synergistaceae bacterium]|nr:patatin [Synergistaceae bacterium]
MRKHLKLPAFILSLFFIVYPMAAVSLASPSEAMQEAQRHHEEWGFPHKEGIILVLSGGGTKGLAHIGVLEVLERENIPIAAIVGTSMGAVIGGLYASGYNAGEMREIISELDLMEIISNRSFAEVTDVNYNKPPSSGSSIFNVYVDGKNKLRGNRGMLRAKGLYSFLNEMTTRVTVTDFNLLPIPFAAMATDLETGETVVLRDGNLASALRASVSIPGIFEPWEMNGRLLVDGGLRANLPVFEAKKLFPGHPIVAINLSPEKITKKREELRSLLEVMAQTIEILMIHQVRANAAAADLVIAPRVKDFGVLQSDGYDEIIARGVAAAERVVEQLQNISCDPDKTFCEFRHIDPPSTVRPTVTEIRFEGIPKRMAGILHEKYDKWIGELLDMQKVADAVKLLSTGDDFVSVEGRAQTLTENTVAIIFSIERPSKYEFGVSGYASNIYPDNWLSLSAQMRDIFFEGDVGAAEYRFGSKWGAMLRYFTPKTEHDTQFGLVISGREEGFEPANAAAFDLERYTARIAWYRDINRKARIGLGYAFERIKYLDDISIDGPYISFTFNNLDDPVLPTKGFSVNSDIWFLNGETTITHTRFHTYLPVWPTWNVVLSGGLKTGDVDDPAYAATLGTNEELFSLAAHPLLGDQAYWLHLGAAKTITRSWWGGINLEVFGNFGQVMKGWSNDESWWEAGIALSAPTTNFSSRIMIIYDQGGELTFGYSIGIPMWWNGPLP